jgi:hypothetical protein
MGIAGNSAASDDYKRFELALRGNDPERVLMRARNLAKAEGLSLGDAVRVTSFLVKREHGDAGAWQARLFARIILSKPDQGLEFADHLFSLVQGIEEDRAQRELARLVRA